MKTNLLLFAFSASLLLLFASCEKEDIFNSNIEDRESPSSVITKAISPEANYALTQLRNIPVHIFFPQNAAASIPMYLSCNSSNTGVTLKSTDDGSGRQRWLIEPASSSVVTENYKISSIGGYYSNNRFLATNNATPLMSVFAAGSGTPQLNLWQVHYSSGYWLFSGNYIKQPPYPAYDPNAPKYIYWLGNEAYGKNNMKLVQTNSQPSSNQNKFIIEPVEQFTLKSVSYETIAGQEYANYEVLYLNSYPVVNNTPYAASRSLTISEQYSYTSTFSETEGLTKSRTVSAGGGLSFTVPIIKVSLSGKVDVTTRTDHTYSYITSNTQTKTFSFSQTVTTPVPAYTTVTAWVEARKYTFNTKYIGNYTNSSNSASFNLRGNWNGSQLYEVRVILTNQSNNMVIGYVDQSGNFTEAKANTYFDSSSAVNKINEYKIEVEKYKSSNM